MNCPACDRSLTQLDVGTVTVDACVRGCGGIWFDPFELQRVDEPHELAGEKLIHISRDPSVVVDASRKRECPRCANIKLRRHLFSRKSKVEVDHCPNCGGYWLDAGELEKIRREQQPASPELAAESEEINAAALRYIYRLQVEMRGTRREL